MESVSLYSLSTFLSSYPPIKLIATKKKLSQFSGVRMFLPQLPYFPRLTLNQLNVLFPTSFQRSNSVLL